MSWGVECSGKLDLQQVILNSELEGNRWRQIHLGKPWFLVQAAYVCHSWWRTEAKLAIVSTYFWSRRACVRHKRSWPLFSHTFFFFFLSFFLSSTPSTFHPIRGISRAWKFVSPNIFGITRRYMQKKILGNFDFFTKKSWFSTFFFFLLRPAFGHGRLGHSQSLEYSKSDHGRNSGRNGALFI